MNSLSTNMNLDNDSEDKSLKLKEDEELLDKHLNPYIEKTEEFQQIINSTNGQFEFYQDEMKRVLDLILN